VSLAYETKGFRLTGNVQVHLRNPGEDTLAITIRDNAYKSGPVTKTIAPSQQASIVLPLKSSHGWYDFSVLTEASDAESRYAGRVETGQPSFSDPFMGGIA
jgi:phospholipase C